MYVLIDKDNMTIAAKHPQFAIVADLAWFALRDAAYDIFDIDDVNGFGCYTSLDLALLYKNTVGKDCPNNNRNALKQACFEITSMIPANVVNSTELSIQANRINENDERLYMYVKGSKTPLLVSWYTPMTLVNYTTEGAKAALANIKHTTNTLFTASSAKTGVTQEKTKVPATPAKVSQTKTFKAGTPEALIWETADKFWQKAGSPSHTFSEFNAISKLITEELKGEVNTMTLLCQLAAWKKLKN